MGLRPPKLESAEDEEVVPEAPKLPPGLPPGLRPIVSEKPKVEMKMSLDVKPTVEPVVIEKPKIFKQPEVKPEVPAVGPDLTDSIKVISAAKVEPEKVEKTEIPVEKL